jgi:hypothetical protein
VPPRWLLRALEEIRHCGVTRNVDFTLKADEELLGLGLALNRDDACDVLARLSMRDFAERPTSTLTGEFMYVFTPRIAGVPLYVKVILRRRCVVVSFHEEDEARNADEI